MIAPGLVSITFRKLSTDEIIELVKRSGLKTIEWGGDIHVPHGNIARAKEVGEKTRAAGLAVAAYGSYFKLGQSAADGLDFKHVLASAEALRAPVIRIWAGIKGSAEYSPEERIFLAKEARTAAAAAAEKNIKIAFEFHGHTLTDTTESALQFLKECDHPNILTYWQPPLPLTHEERIKSLKAVLPQLSNIHAFSWNTNADGSYTRLAFADHADNWKEYFAIASKLPSDRAVMIEFVKDDSTEQFLEDARALKALLGEFLT